MIKYMCYLSGVLFVFDIEGLPVVQELELPLNPADRADLVLAVDLVLEVVLLPGARDLDAAREERDVELPQVLENPLVGREVRYSSYRLPVFGCRVV